VALDPVNRGLRCPGGSGGPFGLVGVIEEAELREARANRTPGTPEKRQRHLGGEHPDVDRHEEWWKATAGDAVETGRRAAAAARPAKEQEEDGLGQDQRGDSSVREPEGSSGWRACDCAPASTAPSVVVRHAAVSECGPPQGDGERLFHSRTRTVTTPHHLALADFDAAGRSGDVGPPTNFTVSWPFRTPGEIHHVPVHPPVATRSAVSLPAKG